MRSSVDDTQKLLVLGEAFYDFFVGLGANATNGYTFHGLVQPFWLWHDFRGVFQSDVKTFALQDGRLSGRAQDNCTTVVCNQFSNDSQCWLQQFDGDALSFVQNNDAVANTVQFPATTCFRCEQ